MNSREAFNYKVHLMGEDGTPIVWEITNYWSPDYAGVDEELMRAAKAEAYMAVGRRQTYTPISVERV